MTRSSGKGKKKKPTLVTSSRPPKHGEPGYDPEKDQLNVGFQLGSYGGPTAQWLVSDLGKNTRNEIDAYDFYTDKKTGLRPGQKNPPSSGMSSDLVEDGVDEKTTLPPVGVWRRGEFLVDLLKDEEFMKPGPGGFDELPFKVKHQVEKFSKEELEEVPESLWNIYVVSGEGTPGNNLWRVYYLPQEIAADIEPKHPLMWTEKQKRGTKYSYGYGSGYGYGAYDSWNRSASTKTEPQKPQVASAPKLPLSVRMRCACGHWFKMDDIAGHTQVCPATEATGEADWAMMCDSSCGCQTLDEASKCKPGFPRQKAEKAEEEKEETQASLTA
jgi:hypothetical protein